MSKITVVLGLVILLVSPIAADTSAETTSCKTCQSPPSDDITLCRCDDQCTLYGDCCPDHSTGSPMINDSLSTTVGYMECHSRYRSLPVLAVGDAYYMVSSCPSNWAQDKQFADLISYNCTTSTDPDIEDFPPVSDPSTGITYRNEFCAICHNVNTPTLLTWPTRLRCEGDFKNISQTQNITLELIYQFCSRCSFDPPNSTVVMDTLRWCIPIEAMCPPFSQPGISDIYNETEYEEIIDSCTNGEYNPIHELIIFSPSSPLSINIVYLRNLECAQCKQLSNSTLTCRYLSSFTHNTKSNMRCSCKAKKFQNEYPLTTQLVLYVTGSGAVYAISSSSQINGTEVIRCDKYQLFNSVLGCTDIVCPNGHILVLEKCLPNNITMESSTLYNCTIVPLDGDDYVIVDNSSIQFGEEVIDVLGYDNNGRPLICNDSNSSTSNILYFPVGYVEIYCTGSLLSIIASICILVTHAVFQDLCTLPGKLLMNLSVSCLMGDFMNAIGSIVNIYVHSIPVCITVSIILHYFLITRFVWMNCLGVEYIRRLIQVYKFDIPCDNAKLKQKRVLQRYKPLFAYMLVGWGIPFVIVVITSIVNFTVNDSVGYGVEKVGQGYHCWIMNDIAEIVTFVLPIALVILINFIMFAVVVVMMCILSQNTLKELQRKQRIIQVRLVLGIFSVLGFTWIIGIIALIARKPWSWYPYIVAQSLHAVLIAFTFLTTKKILLMYRKLLKVIWYKLCGTRL